MLRNLVLALALLASIFVISDAKVDGLEGLGYDEFIYPECEIYNSKYKNWFLHAEQVTYSGEKRNVTLGRFVVFSDKKQHQWQIVPAEGIKNGFYLKNSKYGEQLYATSSFIGFNPFTQKRRKIYTWRLSADIQMDKKAFVWIFHKTDRKPDEFYIYNLAYREPLYAGSWAYKGEVFTWHEKHEDHDQFRWTIKCLTGQIKTE